LRCWILSLRDSTLASCPLEILLDSELIGASTMANKKRI
jgi:hypothetical protein